VTSASQQDRVKTELQLRILPGRWLVSPAILARVGGRICIAGRNSTGLVIDTACDLLPGRGRRKRRRCLCVTIYMSRARTALWSPVRGIVRCLVNVQNRGVWDCGVGDLDACRVCIDFTFGTRI